MQPIRGNKDCFLYNGKMSKVGVCWPHDDRFVRSRLEGRTKPRLCGEVFVNLWEQYVP